MTSVLLPRIALRFLFLSLLLAAPASAQEPLYMQLPSEVPPVTGPVVAVRVLADGTAVVDGVASDSAEVVTVILAHIRAHPDGGVAFSASREVPYSQYIHVLDAIKAAYLEERDAVAMRDFGGRYANLSDKAKGLVRERVRIRITLAEPE